MNNKEDYIPEWFKIYKILKSNSSLNKLITGRINNSEDIRNLIGEEFSLYNINIALDFLYAEGIINIDLLTSESIPKLAKSKRDVGFLSDYKGRSPSVKTLSLTTIYRDQIRQEIKKYFEEDENVNLLIRHYSLQLIDSRPYALSDSYIPFHHFKHLLPTLKDSTVDLYDLMKNSGFNITKKDESLYVDMPTPKERELLDCIDPRQSIVRLVSKVWSDTTLVEVCLLCDRADLYEFNYSIAMHI